MRVLYGEAARRPAPHAQFRTRKLTHFGLAGMSMWFTGRGRVAAAWRRVSRNLLLIMLLIVYIIPEPRAARAARSGSDHARDFTDFCKIRRGRLQALHHTCVVYKLEYVLVHVRVPCTVYRVPCTVYRVPCTVYRVPCTHLFSQPAYETAHFQEGSCSSHFIIRILMGPTRIQ